jgi:molecular chaperone GrpE
MKTKDNSENHDEKYNELHDKYLRISSDFANFKKSKELEMSSHRKFALQEFVTSILPAIDSLELACRHIRDDEKTSTLFSGLVLTIDSLMQTMEMNKVVSITPKEGDTFNAQSHMTIHYDETDEVDKEGTISKLHLRGYKIHDRLLRPARVSIYIKKTK